MNHSCRPQQLTVLHFRHTTTTVQVHPLSLQVCTNQSRSLTLNTLRLPLPSTTILGAALIPRQKWYRTVAHAAAPTKAAEPTPLQGSAQPAAAPRLKSPKCAASPEINVDVGGRLEPEVVGHNSAREGESDEIVQRLEQGLPRWERLADAGCTDKVDAVSTPRAKPSMGMSPVHTLTYNRTAWWTSLSRSPSQSSQLRTSSRKSHASLRCGTCAGTRAGSTGTPAGRCTCATWGMMTATACS